MTGMKIEVEKARVRTGMFASSEADGFNGFFCFIINGERIKVIASDGEGWEHVSVSKADQPTKVPNWDIMCKVKELFWSDDVWVCQFHPPKSEYVNNHPGCLHLWRPRYTGFATPPSILTGWKDRTFDQVASMSKEDRLAEYASLNLKTSNRKEIQ